LDENELLSEAKQLIEALGAAPGLASLPFASLHSDPGRPEDLDAALAGRFRLGSQQITLKPPVDWWDAPYQLAGEYAFPQNSFVFADSLLSNPRASEVIGPLAEIFADWLRMHPKGKPLHPHRYAWHDHAAAGRIIYIAFVLREGIRLKRFDGELGTILAVGVLQHAEYLLSEQNYAAHHNHGLFCAASLALASRSLEPAPQAQNWAKIATQRFSEVLNNTISHEDALHLEHSPYYHWIIHRVLSKIEKIGLFRTIDLSALIQRMEDSGAWLVGPDGTLPQFGDTPADEHLPRSVQNLASKCSGLRAFAHAGYIVVKKQTSSLIITAAYHPTAHKHADDGSFCLYENGYPLVVDTGNPGYDYESAERRYATSPKAHSTICIDGFDWAEDGPPYGSGVVGFTEVDGLYAALTCNPGAVPKGGAARRVFLYAPGRFLVVIDDIASGTARPLAQHLPLAPGIDALLTDRTEATLLRNTSTVARLVPFSVPDVPAVGIAFTRGQYLPQLSGFIFPSPGAVQSHCHVTFSSLTDAPRAFALLLGSTTSDEPVLTWNASDVRVTAEVSGVTESTLSFGITDNSIELT
jgi:Heparinase II/III-like protein/Heparinase II/III N-terminus